MTRDVALEFLKRHPEVIEEAARILAMAQTAGISETSTESWVGSKVSPVGEYVKFDVLCPKHPDTEMLTGGGDLAEGEKVMCRCPICGHEVLMRVWRIATSDNQGES